METCYKVFRTDLLKNIPIRSHRFGFEPGIIRKAAKRTHHAPGAFPVWIESRHQEISGQETIR